VFSGAGAAPWVGFEMQIHLKSNEMILSSYHFVYKLGIIKQERKVKGQIRLSVQSLINTSAKDERKMNIKNK